MPLRCSLMRHLRLRKGENAVNCNPDDPGVQQVGKPGELRAAGAYRVVETVTRAVAPLPPRQSRAERSGTARRRVAGYAKTAAGRPARRINDQIQVTHRLLHCSGCIVDNAIGAELT